MLDKYPVIDGHNDFPMAIRDLFHNDMDSVNMDHDLTQVSYLTVGAIENRIGKDFKMLASITGGTMGHLLGQSLRPPPHAGGADGRPVLVSVHQLRRAVC